MLFQSLTCETKFTFSEAFKEIYLLSSFHAEGFLSVILSSQVPSSSATLFPLACLSPVLVWLCNNHAYVRVAFLPPLFVESGSFYFPMF